MTAEHKQPARKPEKYRIVAARTQSFEFEVTARSPEAACRVLQSRLRHDDDFVAPAGARPSMSGWNLPTDKGDAWLIDGGDLLSELPDGTFWAWDGHEIIRTGL